MPDPSKPAETPKSYPEAKEQTAYFQALLERYDNDWDQAVEAQRRGEQVEIDRSGDAALP